MGWAARVRNATAVAWPGTCAALLVAALASCAAAPRQDAESRPPLVLVTERFATPDAPEDEIDSLAVWRAPDGELWLLATAKTGGRILRYDGLTGAARGSFGPEAATLRPNGIAVADDIVFVVDQRAQRVVLLRLPGGEMLGAVGEGVLRNPYGLWVQPLAGGRYALYVTDSYRLEGGAMPPPAQLGERVRRLVVHLGEAVGADAVQAFGETAGEGVLLTVESIAGDPAHGRLLIAEEERDAPSGLRVYGMDGRYAGHSLAGGVFGHQAEGIVLVGCDDGSGYWVASDQDRVEQRFHVFDRESLRWVGDFRGRVARDTDGLAYAAGPLPGFPHGVLYAQHDNRAVVAYDWAEIAAALQLPAGCE